MEVENTGDEKKFSFKGLSLGKTAGPRKLRPGVLNEDVDEKNETDFITGVAGKEIESESGRNSKPEEIVIPLQPNSLFKGFKRDKIDDKRPSESSKKRKIETDSPKNTRNDLEANAINELLEDAERNNEDWDNRDSETPKNLIIPTDENRTLDKSDSDESESDREETDYEKVPISAFGTAMLRGMGWKEGEGIGTGSRKKVVDTVQAVARPKGLGLGADRSAHQMKNQVNGKGHTKVRRDDEELELRKGAHCQITEGTSVDMYGEVISIDDESTRIHVKLTLGDAISISQFKIRLVTKSEYLKFSKYINKNKVDKYREDERMKETKSKEKSEERSDRDDRDRKNQKREDRYEGKKNNERKRVKSWLKPQLRVRIVDKNFSKGKYFKEKVSILDVLDRSTCHCRTDNGQLLELRQDQLETVVPRPPGRMFVSLVGGEYAGRLGEILEKDKARCVVVVQLLCDRDRVVELSYDQVCEYTGDIDADFDY